MSELSFCWCTIHVGDLEKSLAFYTGIVGLTVDRRFSAGPGTDIAFLGEGAAKVELICVKGHKPEARPEGISLGFRVENLDDKMAFIKEKGLPVDSGPIQPNEHVRFFYVRDPDGLKIQFVENR